MRQLLHHQPTQTGYDYRGRSVSQTTWTSAGQALTSQTIYQNNLVAATGKPMIIVDPIPGQEQRNCECLLEGGAALRLFDVHDAPYKVERLLSDPRRLEEMRRNAKSLGHPSAGRDIVADILRRGQSSS